MLIRPSGTEQVIRILVEGEDKEKIKSISQAAEKLIIS